MRSASHRFAGALRQALRAVAIAFCLAFGSACDGVGSDGTIEVTTRADTGPGSFRDAIDLANRDATIRTIELAPGLRIALHRDVVYTGAQPLAILGNASEMTAAPDAMPAAAWEGGLFVSKSGASIRIEDLAFTDSFNNGVALFVPADAEGDIRVTLVDVTIERARFHGLLVDEQNSTAFDTDGALHPTCKDPWPVDSHASIVFDARRLTVRANGTLAGGFDTGTPFERDGESLLSGCPADFDGVRIDEGGSGSIHATLADSEFTENLADGVELDERGKGEVTLAAHSSRFARNGDTGTVDLDDGLDVDESGPGSLEVTLDAVEITDNRDEGLDLDEAGPGDATVTLDSVESARNEDQNIKVDEEGAGDLLARIARSTLAESRSQYGAEFVETDAGDLDVSFDGCKVNRNEEGAIAAAQHEPGSGRLVARGSDLTHNTDRSLHLERVEAHLDATQVD